MSERNLKSFWQENKRYAISALIVFFTYSVIVTGIPKSPLRTAISAPLQKTINLLGLNQKFFTFSPKPPQVNKRLYAFIRFADGTTKLWFYPDVEKLGTIQRKIRAPRFRIFMMRYLAMDSRAWPDFARYVARENSSAGKTPVFIAFYFHIANIPPLNASTGKIEQACPPCDLLFFKYNVESKDLK